MGALLGCAAMGERPLMKVRGGVGDLHFGRRATMVSSARGINWRSGKTFPCSSSLSSAVRSMTPVERPYLSSEEVEDPRPSVACESFLS
jgi:hypothetical protein